MPSKLPMPAVLTLLAGLTILLAACASARDESANPGGGSTGSAEPAGTARPQPTLAPTTPTTTPVPCPYDGTPIAVQRGGQPAPVCLHPGDVLTLTAPPSTTQPWQPPASSDQTLLTCTTRHLAEGALTVTCRALNTGSVTVSLTTAPFAGDPHGPPQYTWTLTVQVIAPS